MRSRQRHTDPPHMRASERFVNSSRTPVSTGNSRRHGAPGDDNKDESSQTPDLHRQMDKRTAAEHPTVSSKQSAARGSGSPQTSGLGQRPGRSVDFSDEAIQ